MGGDERRAVVVFIFYYYIIYTRYSVFPNKGKANKNARVSASCVNSKQERRGEASFQLSPFSSELFSCGFAGGGVFHRGSGEGGTKGQKNKLTTAHETQPHTTGSREQSPTQEEKTRATNQSMRNSSILQL